MLQIFQKLKQAYSSRPSVKDVESFISTSSAGVLVTGLNAIIFAVFERDASNSFFLNLWLILTLAICAMVFSRSRKARDRKVKHVSRKAVKRLYVFALMLALP